MPVDKAGQPYWEGLWHKSFLPDAVNPRERSLNNFVNRKFHESFCRAFAGLDTKRMRLVEIGCARSGWLPYFAREFGMEVCGVDYSDLGCEQARQILERDKVKGTVSCHDMFKPPAEFQNAFDAVVSFGVVEHFEDTAACLSALATYLKPGGLMFTNIPNMRGLTGLCQKLLNRPVFDIHVPLDRAELARAHQTSGLKVISSEYFLLLNLGVVNCENLRGRLAYNVSGRLRSWMSKLIWVGDPVFRWVPTNQLTSPYINCLSTKPRV